MRLEYKPDNENTNTEELADQLKETLKGDNIKQEMLDQYKKMKDKPLKERLEYLGRYYGGIAIGAIVVIGILISIISTVLSKKDTGFKAIILNATGMTTSNISEEFAEYAGIDLKHYECDIDTGAFLSTSGFGYDDTATLTRYMADIQSRDLDCVIFHSERFYTDSLSMLYADLRDYLSEEDLERFKDNLYYVDYTEAERLQNSTTTESAFSDSEPTLDEMNAHIEERRHPENMDNPIPVGIILTDCPYLNEAYAYPVLTPVYGIIINTQRPEVAVSFLHFLYNY